MEWGAIRLETRVLAAAAGVSPAKQRKKVGVEAFLELLPLLKHVASCGACGHEAVLMTRPV